MEKRHVRVTDQLPAQRRLAHPAVSRREQLHRRPGQRPLHGQGIPHLERDRPDGAGTGERRPVANSANRRASCPRSPPCRPHSRHLRKQRSPSPRC